VELHLLDKLHMCVCVSQEECARLREGVPYGKVYRYNPKYLCPKLNFPSWCIVQNLFMRENTSQFILQTCSFTVLVYSVNSVIMEFITPNFFLFISSPDLYVVACIVSYKVIRNACFLLATFGFVVQNIFVIYTRECFTYVLYLV
jgi:hypothetical protein